MAVIKLTDDTWYDHQAGRVLLCLKAWLPREGGRVADVKPKLSHSGFDLSDEEWLEIATRLTAQGLIEILPE